MLATSGARLLKRGNLQSEQNQNRKLRDNEIRTTTIVKCDLTKAKVEATEKRNDKPNYDVISNIPDIHSLKNQTKLEAMSFNKKLTSTPGGRCSSAGSGHQRPGSAKVILPRIGQNTSLIDDDIRFKRFPRPRQEKDLKFSTSLSNHNETMDDGDVTDFKGLTCVKQPVAPKPRIGNNPSSRPLSRRQYPPQNPPLNFTPSKPLKPKNSEGKPTLSVRNLQINDNEQTEGFVTSDELMMTSKSMPTRARMNPRGLQPNSRNKELRSTHPAYPAKTN